MIAVRSRDQLPQAVAGEAKKKLNEVVYAETTADAEEAVAAFAAKYASYPNREVP